MKQGIRLYDFSLSSAAIVILAYVVLLSLCAGMMASAENPLPCLTVLILLITSFVALTWAFVWRAPVLTEQSVCKGKTEISKADVACEVYYNTRYREMTVRLGRKSKPDAKGKTDCITVQATKQNLKRLELWLGYAPEIPEKPQRK